MAIRTMRTATILSALLLAPFWIGTAAGAEELPSITVHGAGSVETPPDMAIVSAGAVSQAEQAAKAMAENNGKVAQILALAEAAGVAGADVQTEAMSIHPVYEDKRGEAGLPVIAGFRVSNAVSIRLRKLDKLGDFLGRLATAGANNIGNIRFGVSDPETLLRQARRRAVADARARAMLYAKAAGVALGRVVRITETGSSLPHRNRRYSSRRALDKAGAAVPVAPGTLEFGATVTIRFAIAKSG